MSGVLANRVLAGIAGQLREPTGAVGRVVGRLLNRGNGALIAAAAGVAGETVPLAAVADVGFGGGLGLELLLARRPDVAVHGVEMSDTMRAAATERFRGPIAEGRLRVHAGTLQNLPFDDGALDAVISTNTIYFVADLGAAFRELRRVLGPSGRLVVGIGDPDRMARMPFTQHGFVLRSVDEVITALADAGFDRAEDRRVGRGPGAFHLLVATAR